MTAPSKRTVTDKLCTQVCSRVIRKVETEYDKAIIPSDSVAVLMAKIHEVETKLLEMLSKRPITRAEIDSLGNRVWISLRKTIRAASRGDASVRYREAVNIETGEKRLIHDYE